ncbi:MAG: hypothetical protein AAGC44_08195 [Planctomycetota bacterium]
MKKLLLCTWLILGLAGLPLPAAAQPADPVSPDKRALSAQFTRAALGVLAYGDLAQEEAQTPGKLAEILLAEALRLDPNNTQVWKLQAELARQNADGEAYEQALLGYLRTGIQDDKAQLDLIQHRLSGQNTLDDQYKAVTKLLESEGARRLSAPLRSRLASFAAATAAELVEPQDYARWAVEAARLDPTNAEAAQMLLGIVLERGGDPVKHGTALINLVRATPLDAEPRVELAGVLASQALFERAAQQYTVAGTRLSSQPLPMDAYRNWAHCLVILGQDTVALQLIEELESALSGAPEDTEEGETQPDAAPVPLPVDLEVLRLSTLDSETDTDAAIASFNRIRKTLEASEQADAAEQLALIAAVFGPSLNEADAICQTLGDDAALKPIALGWIALRQGEAAKALELLERHEQTHVLAACGMAVVTAKDDAHRDRELRRLIQTAPGSLAAVEAARRVRADGGSVEPTPQGKALGDLMGRFSESMWLVDVERSPWLDVRMQIRPARFKQGEPIHVDITVWNTTRFPMAIGQDKPIRNTAFILLTATAAGQPLPPIEPIVIDLQRKLVLGAGERLQFSARIDYSQFGSIVAANPGAGITFDARLIVNPMLSPNGAWLPAGVGGLSIVRDCLIQGRSNSAAAVDDWIKDLGSEDVGGKLRALARLAALSPQQQPQLVNPAVQLKIRDALVGTWPTLSPIERAWMIAHATNLEEQNAHLRPLVELVQQSDEPSVWLAYVATQVTDPSSEMLSTAVRQQDLGDASTYAEMLRRLLRELETLPDPAPGAGAGQP